MMLATGLCVWHHPRCQALPHSSLARFVFPFRTSQRRVAEQIRASRGVVHPGRPARAPACVARPHAESRGVQRWPRLSLAAAIERRAARVVPEVALNRCVRSERGRQACPPTH
eukprot:scaffold64540_cov37-Tisochrysis_lutea.AAC.3